MLLSHLGLPVSHISASTSFYLAALQPLGYHYVGQQGDSIGIGIKDAELFLTQQHSGGRIAPTHIAFAAKDRLTVRNCYSAALNAGGRPSGPPGYRSNDCSCFNAAVEDLDGNTIEFIFRDHCESEDEAHSLAPEQTSRAPVSVKEEMQSIASKASQARSKAQVVSDLASATSKATKKSNAPTPGISRSRTEPVASTSGNSAKNLMGPLIGVAAGAALVYAAFSSERDSTRDEAEHASSMQSKARSVKDGLRRSIQHKSTASKTSNRDYDVIEPSRSSRKPPRSMRAIEAPSYDDNEVQETISRYTASRSRRPVPQRSRTYDALEYVPRQRSSTHSDRFSMKRASTLPVDPPHYYIEAPKETTTSQYNSRSRRRSSFDASSIKRHDSGVSMHSYRSRRSNEDRRRSSFSNGSTSKPSRRSSLYESAAEIPLSASRTMSRYTTATKRTSSEKSKSPSWISAAQKPLPQSRATSYISAAQVAAPPSQTYGGYTDEGEESDGLGDMKTIVPDDSISCVDFSAPKKKSKSSNNSKSSRHTWKRSEAESDRTLRPAKPRANGSRQSAMTLPASAKEDQYSRGGKRSTHTYT